MLVAETKPKPFVLHDPITMFAMSSARPVHYAVEKRGMKFPLCGGEWCASPIITTDDIKRVTCKKCIGMILNITYKTKCKGESHNEKRTNTNGVYH